MKKITSILLILIMLSTVVFALPMTAQASTETYLPCKNSWSNYYVSSNSIENFYVNIPSPGRLKLSIFAATYDSSIYVELYDDDYEEEIYGNRMYIDKNKPSTSTIDKVLAKGRYHLIISTGDKSGYIKLKPYYKKYGCNTKSLSTYDNPNVLSSGKIYTDAFTYGDDGTSWYRLTIPSTRIVQLAFTNYTYYNRFNLYSKDLNKEYFSFTLSGSESSPEKSIQKLILRKGTYYLQCERRCYDGMFKISYLSYVKPKLNYSRISIKRNYSKQLKVSGGSGKTTWSNSNRRVAIVYSNGKVVAKGKGSCYITARKNGYNMRCYVSVR